MPIMTNCVNPDSQVLIRPVTHRDRIAPLSVPSPLHKEIQSKNLNILLMPMPTLMPTPGVVQQLFLNFIQEKL